MNDTNRLSDALDRARGIEGVSVELKAPGDPASAVIVVDGPQARARIALQGAQVLSWRPGGGDDALWCSPMIAPGSGKAMRGGIPICWPWFGPHGEPGRPQHGYARTAIWRLDGVVRTAAGWDVALGLPAGAEPLSATLDIKIGHDLSLELRTRNEGSSPAALSAAFHTYFRVGDVTGVRVRGLDGADYRDNADGGRSKTQHGDLTISGETVALFDTSPAVVVLEDPTLGRRIHIDRRGAASTIVWNPMAAATAMADIPAGQEREFICVESGAVGAASVTLVEGAIHALGVVYRVEPLGP
jgi:D-hexose-6-phosphate mutarotase